MLSLMGGVLADGKKITDVGETVSLYNASVDIMQNGDSLAYFSAAKGEQTKDEKSDDGGGGGMCTPIFHCGILSQE